MTYSLECLCNDRGVQCKGRSRGSYSDNVFDHKPWGFIYMRKYMWDLIIITEPHAVPHAYLLCCPTVPSYLTVPPKSSWLHHQDHSYATLYCAFICTALPCAVPSCNIIKSSHIFLIASAKFKVAVGQCCIFWMVTLSRYQMCLMGLRSGVRLSRYSYLTRVISKLGET